MKINIWDDIFKKYFDGEAEKEITNFIKNRNHVAHNKPLTNASYEKMKNNITTVEILFNTANAQYEREEPSDELYETWDSEQEAEWFEQEYAIDRIKNETGIDILSANGIFDLFDEVIHEIYDRIDNSEYFNYSIEVGELNSIEETPIKQSLFIVKSNVSKDFNFIMYASLDINDGRGEDSRLNLWIEKADKSKPLEANITYHNGEAHEDSLEGYFVPDEESYLEREELTRFIEDLSNYIREDMNVIKIEVDTLSYIVAKDGGDSPVANLPCWNCGQEYISLDDNLYEYGHCIICGEENELLRCNRCGTLYSSDEGDTFMGLDFCNYCAEKIENE